MASQCRQSIEKSVLFLYTVFERTTCSSMLCFIDCTVVDSSSDVMNGCRGQMPADAEYHYLEHAKRLDMYGAHLYQAQLKAS